MATILISTYHMRSEESKRASKASTQLNDLRLDGHSIANDSLAVAYEEGLGCPASPPDC